MILEVTFNLKEEEMRRHIFYAIKFYFRSINNVVKEHQES